jgi:hypothetical protein
LSVLTVERLSVDERLLLSVDERLLLSVDERLLLSVDERLLLSFDERFALSVLVERLLLSVEVVVVAVLPLLLRLLVSVEVFVVAVLPLLLRLLLSVIERSLLSVVERLLLSVDMFCVAVLPPRATIESSACAESEKASVMAVTSKVLFMRIPLWVWLVGRSAVAPTTLYLHERCQLHNAAV